jgi:gliding motility-associated-like protein
VLLSLLFFTGGEIKAQCSADFYFQGSFCDGSKVFFFANDTSKTLTYKWNFGDTASGYANNDSTAKPIHIFSKNGIYTITLLVSDTSSCSDTIAKSLVVFANPTADFKVQSVTCEGVSVDFTAIDTSISNQYSWNFGDIFSGFENTDSIANPAHLFSKTGAFTITLIVRNANGCSDTVQNTINILPKPKADFLWTNSCKNISTAFSDSSKAGAGDSLVVWKWNLGNAALSSIRNPQTTYNGTGNYDVELIVLSYGGCRDTMKKTIKVFDAPTGSSDINNGCENTLINFVADTLTGAISYRWDFGDSSFISVRTASHVYLQKGYFFPQLNVDFGSTKCTVPLDSILINPLPDASFWILNDTQCFNQNNVCLKFVNMNQKIRSRIITFDDGSFDDFSPLSDSVVCHQYTDVSGGIYFISVELVDSNNCLASFTDTNAVFIYPPVIADFTFTGGNGCFTTTVNVTNSSNESPPLVRNFLWDFGDGEKDSTNWTNVNHIYTASGIFNITLSITDTNGCTDLFTDTGQITNTSYVVDASMDSSSGKCKNDNYFHFRQTPIAGASINWVFTPTDNSNNFSTQFRFPNAGLYYPQVTISKNGCDSTLTLDSLIVRGPTAVIGSILNRYQCQIKDTVYYRNNSVLFRNQGIRVFWDAGDPFAPNCTGNTKDSVNVGMNCRYSLDSLLFKHMYMKGREGCYYTKLVVEDTILGCRDSVYEAIPLMAPRAQGLFTPSVSSPCPGPEAYKTLTFNLNQSQPGCLKYAWWLMWDSLTASKSGNFDSFWVFNSYGYNYTYDKYAGDSSGNVTIGLIVENGLDTNGKVCRDTGWFHNTVKVTQMSPMFTSDYDSKKYYCTNSLLRFFPVDSSQTVGSRFVWNFGDGTVIDTTDQHAVSHVYDKAGKYEVQLRVFNPAGCVGDTSIWVNIGVFKNFSVSPGRECVGDSLQIMEFNRYYDTITTGSGYWSDPFRALAGMEELRYDLDDGNGFQSLGANPKISYPYPGVYNISMAVKDSVGCWDTLSGYQAVRISGVYAGFLLPADSILCGQTLDLKSLATTIDSTVMKGLAGDSVTKWEWDFGSKYPKSFQANPRRFFAVADYKIKLKVTSTFGCEDSITRDLVLIGPRAHFDFIEDTIGCEPLMVTFKNTSLDGTDFIWQFNDISNSSFGTGMDTNVSFQYRGQGNFYPQLIARGLFSKSGISQVCDDIYPDTSLNFKRTVTVWELPKPQFTWVTNCSNSTTSFTNISTISTGNIVSQQWFFGDGTGSSSPNPMHVYADTGSYRIVLKVVSDRGCEDSVVRTIVISPSPFANFTVSQNCQGTVSLFKDSSFAFNDRIYLWQWGFGDGTGSNQKNPSKLFALDTTYSVKLKVTNVAGCSDSITKPVTIYSNPKPDFSFSNVCDKDSMAFTNTSTSKQGLQSWAWDFGDGSNGFSLNEKHRFNGPGSYNVELKLTTIWGCTDSIERIGTVWPNPISKIVIDQRDQCYKYHNFIFSDSSTILSGTTNSSWRLGNSDSSNQRTFNYRYAGLGDYGVQLISISNFNCRDTSYDSVRVFAMPVVNFSVNQNNQCSRYNQYSFVDLGSIPVGTLTRQWQFGDGNSSLLNPATNHYTDTGIFNPILILTSDRGCKDTSSITVQVWSMPKAGFTLNDSDQCLNGNGFDFTNTTVSSWGGLSHRWEFGDTAFSNGQSPSHSYAAFGTYKVLLIETDLNSCTDTVSGNVVVKPMPLPDFRIADSLQCLVGNRFDFTNASRIVSGTLSYQWVFGDGNTSTLTDPQHSYASFGVKNVKLIVLSESGCSDSVSKILEVYPMPVPGFTINDNEQCLRQNQFVFTNTSAIFSGSLTHVWTFGDASVSSLTSPTHVFQNFGSFNIRLKATSNFGCVDSVSDFVIVNPMPVSFFKINDTTQCLNNQNFVFTDSSSIFSGTLNRRWMFDDGTFSNASIVNKTFSLDSVHRVRLIQTSDRGCLDSLERMFEVFSKPMPAFNVNDTDQCLNINNFLFANSSSIKKGTMTHRWDFGDQKTDNKTNTSHIYSAYGSYMVGLISTSNEGCVDSVKVPVRVDAMPIVAFTVNDTGQCVNNQSFVFKNNSTIPVGNLQYLWKFGDGNTSVLIDPVKQYAKDTTYVVLLTATSNKGCIDSTQIIVDVYPKPMVDFAIDDSIQCLFQNDFNFTNKAGIKYGTLSYNWNFGDGNGSVQTDIKHSYNAFGNYTVRLRALSNLGCVDSFAKVVTIGAMPSVNFTINDPGQCFRLQDFIYTNRTTLSQGSMSSFWQFGDSDSITARNARHIYAAIGNYKPKLIVTTNYGCRDSISHDVWVNPNAMVSFTINDTDQCQNQQNFVFNNSSSVNPGRITSLLWTLDNGQSSGQQQVVSYYPLSGTYTIILQTTTDSGCIDSSSKSIRVYPKPMAMFDVNDSAQCLYQNNYQFTDVSFDSAGVNQYNWNINNETKQTTAVANNVFKTPGYKDITLVVTSLRGCSDTVKRKVYVKPMPDPAFEKLQTFYCEKTGPYSFLPVTPGGSFNGKNIQADLYNPVILWKDTITYSVTVNGCTDSSSQFTQVYPGPTADLGNDTSVCKFEILELGVNSWQSSYLWSNGSTAQTLRVVTPGIYSVIVRNICGDGGDTIAVLYRPINCRFFLPTAFTPNQDGINDRFKPVIFDVGEMSYQIYNRWGELIYEGNQSDEGWDGTYAGQPAQNDMYLVKVFYAYESGLRHLKFSEAGTFLLLR